MNRRQFLKTAVGAGASLWIPQQARAESDFTFIHIPDPHAALGPGTTWQTQTTYLGANQVAENTQCILCTGDFAEPSTDINARTYGWNTIDGLGIPYLATTGNHDISDQGETWRVTTDFDAQLGYSRISGKSWYGDFYSVANSKVNQFIKFDVGAQKFLVLALEWWPRPGVITWAGGIIAANPDRTVIIITHGYMRFTGDLYPHDGPYGGDTYGLSHAGTPPANYDGLDIWAWAKQYPNVRIIFSGHDIGGTAGQHHYHRTDTGDNGNKVYGLWANYQDLSGQVSQYVQLVKFRPSIGKLEVTQMNTTTGVPDSTYWPTYQLDWDFDPLASGGSIITGKASLSGAAVGRQRICTPTMPGPNKKDSYKCPLT